MDKEGELVVKLQKVPDLDSFLPLFLQGDVLALYLKMSDKDQLKKDMKIRRYYSAAYRPRGEME